MPTDSDTDAKRSDTNDKPTDTKPVMTSSGRKVVKPTKLNLCSVVSKPI